MSVSLVVATLVQVGAAPPAVPAATWVLGHHCVAGCSAGRDPCQPPCLLRRVGGAEAGTARCAATGVLPGACHRSAAARA